MLNNLMFVFDNRTLTYVSGGRVFVGVQVELPGGHGVHLDEGDAPTAPLPLRLVDREEGLEEQIDDAPGNRRGIDSQAGQQVVHVAHVPKLQRGKTQDRFEIYLHRLCGEPKKFDLSGLITCIFSCC